MYGDLVEFRPLTPALVPLLHQFDRREFGGRSFALPYWYGLAASQNTGLANTVVAVLPTGPTQWRVMGFAIFEREDDDTVPADAADGPLPNRHRLVRVLVAKSCRGCGIGTSLVNRPWSNEVSLLADVADDDTSTCIFLREAGWYSTRLSKTKLRFTASGGPPPVSDADMAAAAELHDEAMLYERVERMVDAAMQKHLPQQPPPATPPPTVQKVTKRKRRRKGDDDGDAAPVPAKV